MRSNRGKDTKRGHYLELILLTLLKEEDFYAYRLIEKLEEFELTENLPSLSTLYRRLNRLEEDGIIQSFWTESNEGPKQKNYQITKKGITELDQWIELIKIRRNHIDKIIERYEENK